MASFDMITAVGKAYTRTWAERRYLFRMALIPLLVKYACYTISIMYIGTDNIIRLSLVMIPAYFAEGWFLAHWARTIVMGHRWPFQPSGDDKEDLKQIDQRGRGIVSGMVAFVLINLLIAGYFAFFMSYIPMDIDPQNADPKIAVAGVIMMITTFVAFRFVWLYIPLALNVSWEKYILRLKPFSSTINMLGLWLVCAVPAIVMIQGIGGVVLSALGQDGEAPPVMQGFIILLRVAMDMIKNLLVTAGVAYALIEIFGWHKAKR